MQQRSGVMHACTRVAHSISYAVALRRSIGVVSDSIAALLPSLVESLLLHSSSFHSSIMQVSLRVNASMVSNYIGRPVRVVGTVQAYNEEKTQMQLIASDGGKHNEHSSKRMSHQSTNSHANDRTTRE